MSTFTDREKPPAALAVDYSKIHEEGRKIAYDMYNDVIAGKRDSVEKFGLPAYEIHRLLTMKDASFKRESDNNLEQERKNNIDILNKLPDAAEDILPIMQALRSQIERMHGLREGFKEIALGEAKTENERLALREFWAGDKEFVESKHDIAKVAVTSDKAFEEQAAGLGYAANFLRRDRQKTQRAYWKTSGEADTELPSRAALAATWLGDSAKDFSEGNYPWQVKRQMPQRDVGMAR